MGITRSSAPIEIDGAVTCGREGLGAAFVELRAARGVGAGAPFFCSM